MSSSNLTPLSTLTLNNNVIPVPSLSAGGWLSGLQEKTDLLMAHIFAANASQSFVFSGKVTSVQGIIEANVGNVNRFCQNLRSALEVYFGNYFQHCLCEVTSDDITAENTSSNVTVYIWIQVTELGQKYSVGKVLSLVNSRFASVTNIINNGPS